MGEELPQLETRGLTRQVDGQIVVAQVDMTVFAGEVVAVVGPSGAGKSSLLRLLNRLDEPTSGTVLLQGQDYRQLSPQELRRQVGMIMQIPYLFPGTVSDNIRFGPLQRGEELSSQRVAQYLIQVGLAGFDQRDVRKLSGGEAQRVALARALANRPDILLLDEPTSALDEASKAEVETLLKEIIQSEGLTCILVTHDQAQAARMAQRVMLMEKGRIIRTGLPSEVLHA
jgi:putative ABC transport system ATP-binding protein